MSIAYERYDHIPLEMRMADQWCIAGPDKAPYSVSMQTGVYRASVTDPRTWMDFDDALEAAKSLNAHIGYVIAPGDSLTCIDLDVKNANNEKDPSKWTTREQLDRYWHITKCFDSYTEKSLSGYGLHIWVRGHIGEGCRRDGVEVYSQERFIICTGDVVIHQAVNERQHFLNLLIEDIQRNAPKHKITLEEIAPVDSDEVVWERARNAANNEKFIPLAEGRWQDLGYPSQSEADLSLMSMFAFYSKSNEQCRRLFRMTGLGQRAKAVRDDVYLNRTLIGIRGRQAKEEENQSHAADMARALVEKELAKNKEKALSLSPAVQMAAMMPPPDAPPEQSDIPWPPGFTGYLAEFIYKASPRPVKEVAIVTAIGILAGICGKAYNIPQSGLNMYLILVAQSAIGKESMLSAPAKLFAAVRERIPQAMDFINFNDFASGQALIKAVAEKNCFINISGEWGQKLKSMADDKHVSPATSLRKEMTNLYQKSGHGSIVGGISYSNKENNVASIGAVAYSMMGDTTPGSLYETLTNSMMEDGFMSRFLTVEYKGPRPRHNHNALERPDQILADGIAAICAQALTLMHRNAVQMVARDDEAGQLLHNFDIECDDRINATTNESYRQMWNRAALKTLRLAALLAVADNHASPVINITHAQWALAVVRRDIQNMQNKLTSGDVGESDYSREMKVLQIMKNYLLQGFPKWANVSQAMRADYIIPKRLVLNNVSRINSFVKHRLGATAALNMTIQSLIDSGDVIEVAKQDLIAKYEFHGKCYRLLNMDPSTND